MRLALPSSQIVGFALALMLGGGLALHAAPAFAAGSAAVPSLAAASDADSSASDDLGPTADPPWNPERPVPAAEPWETALRLPGRVASLPLSALGVVSRHTMLVVEENSVVPKLLFALALPARFGVRLGTASLGDRTGLGLSAGYSPPRLGRLLDLEISGSTRKYSRGRVRLGVEHAHAEFLHDWRPRDRFFGLGRESSFEDTSHYAMRSTSVTLKAGLGAGRGSGESSRRHRLSLWAGRRQLVESRGRGDDDSPSLEVQFPALASGLDRPLAHWFAGARIDADGRSGRPHWSRGARAALSAERFDPEGPGAAIWGDTKDAAAFWRYHAEVELGVSFWRDPRTFRLALEATRLDGFPAGKRFAVSDLTRLGGEAGLEGFEPYRFHDRDALLGRLTYLFPLAQHYELDLHAEGGGVVDGLVHDMKLDRFEHCFGIALRPRTGLAPLGAVGVEWSRESVRIRYSLGGVE